MGGRYDKGALGTKQNYDEQPGKFYGLEQSLSFLSKNVARSLNKLPDFNIVKNKDPSFSIPRSERFRVEKPDDAETQRLKDLYYQHQLLMKNNQYDVNNDPSKVL